MTEPVEPILQHFSYAHLRPDLAQISMLFSEVAHAVMNVLPRNGERTVCLRKLLEAKDCAVRAYLQGSDPQPQAAEQRVRAEAITRDVAANAAAQGAGLAAASVTLGADNRDPPTGAAPASAGERGVRPGREPPVRPPKDPRDPSGAKGETRPEVLAAQEGRAAAEADADRQEAEMDKTRQAANVERREKMAPTRRPPVGGKRPQ